MSPRVKKLIGLAIMLPYLIVYFFAAAALADFLPDSRLVDLAYFAVAGVAWAFPFKYLMQWMNADPADSNAAER